jgi:hypothetical protein
MAYAHGQDMINGDCAQKQQRYLATTPKVEKAADGEKEGVTKPGAVSLTA